MDIYHHSNLARQIHTGTYGVQYLDYKVLAQMLMATETDLLRIFISVVNNGRETLSMLSLSETARRI